MTALIAGFGHRLDLGLYLNPGDHDEGETPVPIPNTEAKPLGADGTARGAWWESRMLPGLIFSSAMARSVSREDRFSRGMRFASGIFFLLLETDKGHRGTGPDCWRHTPLLYFDRYLFNGPFRMIPDGSIVKGDEFEHLCW